VPVTVLDLDPRHQRLPLVLSDQEISRIDFLRGDVSDLATVEEP